MKREYHGLNADPAEILIIEKLDGLEAKLGTAWAEQEKFRDGETPPRLQRITAS